MGLVESKSEPPPRVVLVPPLFERDHRGRSRMANSSYDWLFAKPALRWLFHDYIDNNAHALLRLSPGEDPRVSITARFHSSLRANKGRNVVVAEQNSGSMTLRYQVDPGEPLTFMDVKVGKQGNVAQARACYFDVANKWGAFGSIPLTAGHSMSPVFGLRYSSPLVTAGSMLSPTEGKLHCLWLAGRSNGFTAGVQLRPHGPLSKPLQYMQSKDMSQMSHDIAEHLSYAVAYSPLPSASYAGGKGTFTAAVEVQGQKQLVVSFLHHQPVQRLSHNPLEHQDVVGVTNYLDVGLQVVSQLDSPEAGNGSDGSGSSLHSHAQAAELQLAAAWQANKNTLIKGRVGTGGVSAALAFKAWWQPSFWLALSGGFDFRTREPKFGLNFGTENYGNIRYERSQKQAAFGRSLVQRHVALPEDIANEAGEGLLVSISLLVWYSPMY
ncbi:hypothetical protein ABBQ32_010183 [Trebouxia sp. C0010 RCD-2024]